VHDLTGRDPASDVGRLSPAEHRVAVVVADGCTNQEAADRLFLSVKTVDFHLQNIYRKLGLRSRTELAVAMHRAEHDAAPSREPAGLLTWWAGVSDQAADPAAPRSAWTSWDLVGPGLGDQPRSVLAHIDDQPPVPGLDDADDADAYVEPPAGAENAGAQSGNRTGSAPGDTNGSHPYRPRSWKEGER
jgi:DNA-binding CsgD family transcriptional regulator